MASKATWLVILIFVCIHYKCNQASDSNLSREEELELEAQLKRLNKPYIKTFQTKEGDIIDCVDINKQPTLDHPLLKNHKVQIRPSRYPSDLFKVPSRSNNESFILNNNRESCPIGYVPIRRTLKKDLIRLRSVSSSKQESRSQSSNKRETNSDDFFLDIVKFPNDQNVVSHALTKGGRYYGTYARLAVYNLSVDIDQSSSSNIWIVGGPSDDALNVLLVGWQVNPSVNGDGNPRLFIYWTVDGNIATGCYNRLCEGFVQVHQSIFPGTLLSPASTYHGDLYECPISVYLQSEKWWVVVGESQQIMGYWPIELFPYLINGADQIAWGGIAKPSTNALKGPPMGNGHMPNGQYNEGCFIRSIRYMENGYVSQSPNWQNTVSYVSNPGCYDLNANENCGNDNLKYCFTFGGPGGPNCVNKNY